MFLVQIGQGHSHVMFSVVIVFFLLPTYITPGAFPSCQRCDMPEVWHAIGLLYRTAARGNLTLCYRVVWESGAGGPGGGAGGGAGLGQAPAVGSVMSSLSFLQALETLKPGFKVCEKFHSHTPQAVITQHAPRPLPSFNRLFQYA